VCVLGLQVCGFGLDLGLGLGGCGLVNITALFLVTNIAITD